MVTKLVDLDQLDALHKAATPGPWHRDPLYWTMRIVEKAGHDVAEGLPDSTVWPCRDDADYIVALHAAYPAMAEELRRLRKLVREYAEACEEPPESPDPGYSSEREVLALHAIYAAGKEIAK
jgi:hypothetical protein